MSGRSHYHIKHAEQLLKTTGLTVYRLGKGEFFDLIALGRDFGGKLVKVTRPGDQATDAKEVSAHGTILVKEIWHYPDYSHTPEVTTL